MSSPRAPTSIRFVLPLLAGAALIVVLLVAGFAWHDRQKALNEAEATAHKTVALLSEHALKILESQEVILSQVDQMVRGRSWPEIERSRELGVSLKQVGQRLRGASGVWLSDAAGRVKAGSNPFAPGFSVADREYFLAQKESDAGTFVSSQFRSRLTDRVVFAASRRRSHPSGAFDGVVYAILDAEYFVRLWSTVAPELDAVVTLVRADGELLVQHPWSGRENVRLSPASPSMQALARMNSGTLVVPASETDPSQRILAFSKLADYPVYVSLSVSRDAVLWKWRESLAPLLPGIAAALLTFVLLALFASRRVKAQKATEAALLESEGRLRLLAENSTAMIVQLDLSGHRKYVSPACEELLGYTPEELLGTRPQDGVHPDDAGPLGKLVAAMGRGEMDRAVSRHRLRRKDGSYVWVEGCWRLVRSPDGAPLEFVASVRDVSERQRQAEELQARNETLQQREVELRTQNYRFDMALNNMSQGLSMFDAEQKLIVCNDRYAEIYGITPELRKPGTSLIALLEHHIAAGSAPSGSHEQFIAERMAVIAERRRFSQIVDMRDGRAIAILNEPMAGGGWVSTHEDVTERRRSEAQISHMARHDSLTDLPNRILLRERMEQALACMRRDGQGFAVMCLDLDRFKTVNDTLGHPAGDALLKKVAGRLRSCVCDTDTVARLGGDEFAILQMTPGQPGAAAALAKRIVEEIGRPFSLDGQQAMVGTSIGIALAPSDGGDPDLLFKNADMALYRAKAEGRGRFSLFEAEMDAQVQARRALELDLRNAYRSGEFELFYQPLVSFDKGEVSGFEALIRWPHPERGFVPPAEFIPIAEEIGLIGALGEWVLRKACTEAAGWPANVKVAVNLSPEQFNHGGNLVQVVMSALAGSGLTPDRLELEITESVLLAENEGTLSTLHQLRALGVRISLDDFGTGYSSLSYLRKFPFDKIKIDQSFVRELATRKDCSAIVRAVAGLARTLGMTTVAEGVETQEQLEQLRAEGCAEVQGYLFSPPKPNSEVARLIRLCGDRLRDAA